MLKRACSQTVGEQALRLCVWLFAQNHLHQNHIDPGFLFTLWTIQRKLYQHSILVYLGLCPAATSRTGKPYPVFFPALHRHSPLHWWPRLCVRRLALKWPPRFCCVHGFAIEWKRTSRPPGLQSAPIPRPLDSGRTT